MRSSPIFVSVWDRSDNDAPENNLRQRKKKLISEKGKIKQKKKSVVKNVFFS
jgi:hypothetical protein